MGRPRKDSKSGPDTASTAGNVYNASLAAAQQQHQQPSISSTVTNSLKEIDLNSESHDQTALSAPLETSNSSSSSSLDLSATSSEVSATATTTPTSKSQNGPSSEASSTDLHRRSLSLAEIIALATARVGNSTASSTNSVSNPAIEGLNLPEALKNGLLNANSPILNALLPLIRQKLAAKTAAAATARRNSTDPSASTSSLYSTSSRRSSTSSRSEDHRHSHKLAERKRRKEMKDVFDGLKNVLPPGSRKSSKWEILNEASVAIDTFLAQEQTLLNERNLLITKIEASKNSNNNS